MARKPAVLLGEPKACKRCGKEYPNTQEYFYPANAKHSTALRGECRDCYSQRLSEQWAARKAAGKTQRTRKAAPPQPTETSGRDLVQLLDGKKFLFETPEAAFEAVYGVMKRIRARAIERMESKLRKAS